MQSKFDKFVDSMIIYAWKILMLSIPISIVVRIIMWTIK